MNNKKKRYAGLMFVISGILILCSCGKKENNENIQSAIYYVNEENQGLEKHSYELPELPLNQAIEQVLKDLMQCEEKKCKSVYPKDVKIEKWEQSDTDVSLFFSKSYHKMDAGQELLLRAATVKTLCQLKGVDFIKFYVDGKELTDQNDQEIGPMNEDFFVENIGSSIHSYQDKKLKLYYTDKQGVELIEKTIDLRYNSNTMLEKVIVSQLIKGPGDAELSPVIPPETKILGVSVQDGICYVNLDEEFLNVSLHVNPKVTVYSIVNSIIENGEASKVQIMINGESDRILGDVLDLTKPLSMDLELIREEN